MTDLQIDEFENQIPRLLPEMEEVNHPSVERAIREQIKKMVHRACEQELMISSYGTVSVSWKGNDFLITPTWLLQDIPNMPFGSHFAGEEAILDTLSDNIPAVIINNDSVLVTGDNLLAAFDKFEVAEFSANSLTMGSSIGDLVPINSEQVEELRKKFLGLKRLFLN